jgi:hypothetical protein
MSAYRYNENVNSICGALLNWGTVYIIDRLLSVPVGRHLANLIDCIDCNETRSDLSR